LWVEVLKGQLIQAIEENLIDNFEILNEKLFDDYNRDKVVLIGTGSQGERNSALSKIANNTHNNIKLSANDNIIFSSKEIPGNEKPISFLKNSFSYLGLNIISDEDEFVHVSGHPGINEIKEFYSFLKPLSLIPMHGEYLHLKQHLKIAEDLNINKTSLLLSGDICQLDLANKNHKVVDQITIDKLPVIQNSIIEEMNFISERGKILNNGIVSISCIINKNFDNLKMQIYNKGFPFVFNSQLIEEEIKEIFLNKILFIKDELSEDVLNNLLLDICKKTFSRNFSLKPEFFIHISLI
jgi:ribonuclease J